MIVYILIIGILILFLLLPTIFGFVKVQNYGANIPFSRCFFMSLRKTLKEELIKAVSYSQKKNLNIDINIIEAHFLAGGKPLKCFQALEYSKQKNIHLELRQLLAADLADKDLINCIDKISVEILIEICETNLRDRRMKKIDFSYEGKFSNTFDRVCFVELNNRKIKEEVKQKISKYIEYSEIEDKVTSSKIITETLLDTKLWESKGLNLLSQELTIK